MVQVAIDNVPLPKPPPETARLPEDLKARGWKLEVKIVNDDEEHPDYIARNEALELQTDAFPLVARVIEEARKLHEQNRQDEGPVVKEVSFLQIRTDGGTQPRGELDQEVVAEYAEKMKAGVIFPPIIVFHDGSNYWLADGFHRTFGFKKAFSHKGAMRAEVHRGTQRDAILYSLSANAAHGLPRSNEDKRRAVLTLLRDPEWSLWSDGAIAEKAAVTQPFVSKLHRELDAEKAAELVASQNVLSERTRPATWQETIEHQNETGHDDCVVEIVEEVVAPPAPEPKKRIGKDGIARDTSAIGKKKDPDARRVAISPSKSDIQIDAPPSKQTAPAPSESTHDWPEEQLTISLIVNAGKSNRRGILVSGRVGATGKPVFSSGLTLEQLEPLPHAFAYLLGKLRTAAVQQAKAATKAAKTKNQPKAKARKK